MFYKKEAPCANTCCQYDDLSCIGKYCISLFSVNQPDFNPYLLTLQTDEKFKLGCTWSFSSPSKGLLQILWSYRCLGTGIMPVHTVFCGGAHDLFRRALCCCCAVFGAFGEVGDPRDRSDSESWEEIGSMVSVVGTPKPLFCLTLFDLEIKTKKPCLASPLRQERLESFLSIVGRGKGKDGKKI